MWEERNTTTIISNYTNIKNIRTYPLKTINISSTNSNAQIKDAIVGNITNGINQTEWNIFVFRASDIGTQHCWLYNNNILYSLFDIREPTDNNQWQYTVPAYYCINTSLVFPEPSFCQISDFLIYQSHTDISDADVSQICIKISQQYI